MRLFISSPNTSGGAAILDNDDLTLFGRSGSTGIATSPTTIALGRQSQKIYVMRPSRKPISLRIGRRADIHDLLFKKHLLYAVVTGRNQVIEIDTRTMEISHNWTFEGEEDSWHINCLAEIDGRICFAAFGQFIKHRAYKEAVEGTGFVADLASGKKLIDGLSHPHSLVSHGKQLWLCNSYKHEVLNIERGIRRSSGPLGGYTRGLCLVGDSLFVGVSAPRHDETSAHQARIMELDKNTLQVKSERKLPFKEVYDIKQISGAQQRLIMQNLSLMPGYSKGAMRWLSQLRCKNIDLVKKTKAAECYFPAAEKLADNWIGWDAHPVAR